jgi:hypothetical protein
MPKGFAQPYLIVAVLVVIGAGVAVFAGSQNLAGLVLGTKTRNENIYQNRVDGLKVIVISPNASWDLLQYVCKTRDECETSPTSGRWWATVSGAPTTEDGHEVFIEKSPGWAGYGFLKVAVRQTGSSDIYLDPDIGGNYYTQDLTIYGSSSITFR